MNQDRFQRVFAAFLATASAIVAILGLVFGYRAFDKKASDVIPIIAETENKDQDMTQAKENPITEDTTKNTNANQQDQANSNVAAQTQPVIQPVTPAPIVEETQTTTPTTPAENSNSNAPTDEENEPEKDATAPTIVNFWPQKDSTNIPVNSTIEATFNEEIQSETLGVGSFRVSENGVDISGLLTYNNSKGIFIPSEPLKNDTLYTVNISKDIKDKAGNTLDNEYTWTFRTVAAEKPVGNLLADFENGNLDGWLEDATIVAPGFNSNYALQLSNKEGYSTATKKIYDANILKNSEFIELDLNTFGVPLLPGDASALAFEQRGEWHWVSLSSYADPAVSGWQHLKIPLKDFAGLDQNDSVAYLLFRFWDGSSNNYQIDNVSLDGAREYTVVQPTELSGQAVSNSQIDLTWKGNSPKYNVYQDGQKIRTTETLFYSVTGLADTTTYNFYVTAADELTETEPSTAITVTTLDVPLSLKTILGDFESNSLDSWTTEDENNASLVAGLDSLYALRLVNTENNAVGIEKNFDSTIAAGRTKLEFDINTNGSAFYDDWAQVTIDQDERKSVNITDYMDNSISGWQHVRIPLADFVNLDPEKAVAQVIFRFWNTNSAQTDIDNIVLK